MSMHASNVLTLPEAFTFTFPPLLPNYTPPQQPSSTKRPPSLPPSLNPVYVTASTCQSDPSDLSR
ncbi:hypothetical protein K443DRAFT_397666 [Laccaria amethystina LaAM-08-1]|uniref:Uncharacterized protein n=1 Tax=Laccaria amethystina LaAM-08-1 TaxID=1095629 RepID=A0A0C9X755_9AGAR|nr:hypothetical protein K443DRAFT_397666 [Laccaria amethystina LaAM-08-1]